MRAGPPSPRRPCRSQEAEAGPQHLHPAHSCPEPRTPNPDRAVGTRPSTLQSPVLSPSPPMTKVIFTRHLKVTEN